MAVSVVYALNETIVETLPGNTGSAPDASRKVTHTNYDVNGTLASGTTPPATLCALFPLVLSSGAATIDLRALVGTNAAVIDGNGLRPQIVRFKNLGANVMTVATGASNGHNFFTSGGAKVFPGSAMEIVSNDGGEDIDATHKTWDVTGTGSQTMEVTVVLG